MKVNVFFSPANVDELFFSGKTTVVIDVLRATTVITTALHNGAREVIPVNTVDFAMKVSGSAFGGQTILGGERNTKMIEGFNIGNSPLEYNAETVAGKSIILYTTNGSKAVVKAKFSENLFVCCFNNLSAIVKHLFNLDKDFLILCAGNSGAFSLEDTICAGRLVNDMLEINSSIEISDSAKAAVALNKTFGKNILKMLKESEHGQLLIQNGFADDLTYCANVDSIDIIPYYSTGVIKKMIVQ
ncbi:2-phosphosulfolactate phosphatase [Melioribacteraceae bacterium 4301-Me]|uniref:2-phosphosulfolactate phosphatase n=1 Tax=Pyranulibacter aquaticus TaxID=3163344 RepID=UPI003596E750